MSTLEVTKETQTTLTLDEAAAQLYRIVENHFDELGYDEAERDSHYERLGAHLDAKDAFRAKA